MNAIKSFLNEVVTVWGSCWNAKYFKIHFVVSFALFSMVLYFSCLFLSYWEARSGFCLLDPLLSSIEPREFSTQIFGIVHSALFITLILFLAKPRELLKALQAYALLLSLRTISIYLVPLEPPAGMIFLQDPITAFFLNSVNVVTKDLFFSGHISAMCLFVYYTENKLWKTYLMFATPLLAILILWQHVHYSIDILAAPFFAYVSCRLTDNFHERWEFGIDRIEIPSGLEVQRNTN